MIEQRSRYQLKDTIMNLNPREIIALNIKTERQEHIPASCLIVEESIIDEKHRDDLRSSMEGDRGQISPITVRARLNADENIVYDIIDGFHRSAAMRNMSNTLQKEFFAKAVVVYGCCDEELYDLRILAVNSVRSVSYSRLYTWMQLSYKQTDWHKRGFSLSQIISVASRETDRSNLGLSQEDIEIIKTWTTEKAKKWNKTVPSLYMDVSAVEQADPELLKRVRIGGGGSHEKKGIINPASFRVIVQGFPGDFKMQHTIADVVSKHNLQVGVTKQIVDEMQSLTDNKDALTLLMQDPISIIGEFKQDALDSVKPKNTLSKSHLFSGKDNHSRGNNSSDLELKKLIHENEELKIALENARKTLETTSGSGNILWYETIQDLTDIERKVLRMFFGKLLDREDIAEALRILPHSVDKALQCGQKKYLLSQQLNQFDSIFSQYPPEKNNDADTKTDS